MTEGRSDVPVWFITGCSKGLGRALARKVLAGGDRCVVTARDIAGIADIVAAYPERALALALDVSAPGAAAAAVKKAEGHFGSIDVLVNNAGYGYFAAVEEGEDHEVRRMFETNFFAVAELMRCVLPGMRARKRGHIINITSVAGLLSNPTSGYYSATKFAVEGLSQALHKEVAEHGIRVTLIEPGPTRTYFHGASSRVTGTPNDAYARTAGARRLEMQSNSGKQPGDPERSVDIIIEIARDEAPPLHMVLGKNALTRTREKIAQLQHDLDKQQARTLAADFPTT